MLSFVAVLATLCWSANSASAQNYRDTTGDAINPEKAINETRSNTDIQLGVEQGITQGTYQHPGAAPNQQGNHWRYRFQNSQWWYYKPNNQWVVWNGKSWIQPSTMTANTTQPQQHQSGYRGTQGTTQQPAQQPAPMKPQSPAAAAPNPVPAKPQPAATTQTQPATK
jgi:hypothetical protein